MTARSIISYPWMHPAVKPRGQAGKWQQDWTTCPCPEPWLAKPLSGTCLGTVERAGKWLLGQSTKQFDTGMCQIPRDFWAASEGDFSGSCGELSTWLAAQSPGDKDNCLFPEMAVWVIGFVLNKGVGMSPSAGIHHVCPEVLGENTAHFSHVFQNYISWWLPLLGLMTDCMKTKSNSIFWTDPFPVVISTWFVGRYLDRGRETEPRQEEEEKSNRLYTQTIPPPFFEGEQP